MNKIEAVWAASDTLARIALVTLAIATLFQTGFVIIYATRPWWTVRIGRALMLKSASLCVLFWLSVLGSFVTYPHQRLVATVLICIITVAVIYQFFALALSPRHPER